MKSRASKSTGFTLIETIVTIVVLAFVASMMASYFGSAIVQSSSPIAKLQLSQALNQVMEKITAKYYEIPHWRPNTTYAAGTIVIPTTPNRNGYKYRSGGGTTGGQEPVWKIGSGEASTDGTVTWTREADCSPTLSGSCTTNCNCAPGFQAVIGSEGQDYTNTFGSYRVIENRFIKFDPATSLEVNIDGSPTDDKYGRHLKVTIGHRSDASPRSAETRTALFVMR